MEPWNCWALGSPITILGGPELSGKTKALRNDHHNSSHAGQKKFTKTWGRVMKKKNLPEAPEGRGLSLPEAPEGGDHSTEESPLSQ